MESSLDFARHVLALKSETCLNKLALPLDELLEELTLLNELLDRSSESLKNLQELIILLCKIGRVKEFPYDINRDFEEKDFKGVASIASKCLQCLILIIEKAQFLKIQDSSSTYVNIILLCGTHNQLFLWSDNVCVEKQKCLLDEILLHEQLDSLSSLLTLTDTNKTSLVKKALEKLKPTLTQDRWKRNPSSPEIFKWILLSIPYKIMVEVIQDLIPPILLFLDDFREEKQLLGIECAHYLIKNSPITILTWNGLAEVFYDALFRLTYSKETSIIDTVYSCLFILISGLEKDLNRTDRNKKPGKLDKLYVQLLTMAEMESKVNVINSFSKLLPIFINQLGVTVLRHFQRTLRLIFEYLSTYKGPDEESRIFILKALQNLITVAWPRLENHVEYILKMIARLLYDVMMKEEYPKSSSKTKEILIEECKKCLILLRKACPETFEKLVIPLKEIEGQIPVVKIFREINVLID